MPEETPDGIQETEPQGRTYQLKFHTPENFATLHATNITVQGLADGVIVSFFEALPPLVVGTPEEVAATFNNIDTIQANCVGRFIISNSQFPNFVGVLNEALAKQRARG